MGPRAILLVAAAADCLEAGTTVGTDSFFLEHGCSPEEAGLAVELWVAILRGFLAAPEVVQQSIIETGSLAGPGAPGEKARATAQNHFFRLLLGMKGNEAMARSLAVIAAQELRRAGFSVLPSRKKEEVAGGS